MASARKQRRAGAADVTRQQREIIDCIDGLSALGAVIHSHRPANERGLPGGVSRSQVFNAAAVDLVSGRQRTFRLFPITRIWAPGPRTRESRVKLLISD